MKIEIVLRVKRKEEIPTVTSSKMEYALNALSVFILIPRICAWKYQMIVKISTLLLANASNAMLGMP